MSDAPPRASPRQPPGHQAGGKDPSRAAEILFHGLPLPRKSPDCSPTGRTCHPERRVADETGGILVTLTETASRETSLFPSSPSPCSSSLLLFTTTLRTQASTCMMPEDDPEEWMTPRIAVPASTGRQSSDRNESARTTRGPSAFSRVEWDSPLTTHDACKSTSCKRIKR